MKMEHTPENMNSEVTATCLNCKRQFPATVPLGADATLVRRITTCSICTACEVKRDNAWGWWNRVDETDLWRSVCPMLYDWDPKGPCGKAHYLDTMREKGCDMASVMRAVNWQPDPSDSRSGLLLHGPSGTGKTRAAYIRLWDFFAKGKRPRVYSAAAKNGDFAHQVSARFSADQLAAKTWIESVKRAPVLFFDDAGKWVQTQRVEAEFFSVIEARFAMQLPTIITLNAGALNSTRADAQCVDAIKRRLMDYSEVVKFELTKPAASG